MIGKFKQSKLWAGGLAVALTALVNLPTAHAQQATEDWNKVVEAAKKEGEIIIWGQAGEPRRAFWKDAFEKAYPGIKVNLFQAPTTSQRDSRYEQEVKAGVFKADLFVGGGASSLTRLFPAKMVRPIKPLLKPEILDPSHWITEGGPVWMDFDKQYFLISDALVYPTAAVNESVTDLKTYEDLLLPKFDGKIAMQDPRKSGSGFAFSIYLDHEPALGRDYIKKLLSNNRVIFTDDDRQMAEWVDSGRVLIGINIRPPEIEALQKLGGKLKVVGDLSAKGQLIGQYIASDGVLWVPASDPMPHPNAARVYANWFYSTAGQQVMVNNIDTGSNIAGVDLGKVSQWAKRRPGVKYMNMMDQKLLDSNAIGDLRKFISGVLGG